VRYPHGSEAFRSQVTSNLLTDASLYSRPVHPTQLYSSAKGAILCLVLYLFWRRSQRAERSGSFARPLTKPGSTFALAFVLYGTARFLMELLRDDNPYELDSMTISQIMGIALIVLGVVLMAAFAAAKPEKVVSRGSR
jgi:phosphatidylglycerol:prolipoprotein diacylglycerol transferase